MTKLPIGVGATVVSKAGRDEGRTFLVVESVDEEYVLIVDGETHKVEKPKKKKRKHLKLSREPEAAIVERLNKGGIENHEVRSWLSRKED